MITEKPDPHCRIGRVWLKPGECWPVTGDISGGRDGDRVKYYPYGIVLVTPEQADRAAKYGWERTGKRLTLIPERRIRRYGTGYNVRPEPLRYLVEVIRRPIA